MSEYDNSWATGAPRHEGDPKNEWSAPAAQPTGSAATSTHPTSSAGGYSQESPTSSAGAHAQPQAATTTSSFPAASGSPYKSEVVSGGSPYQAGGHPSGPYPSYQQQQQPTYGATGDQPAPPYGGGQYPPPYGYGYGAPQAPQQPAKRSRFAVLVVAAVLLALFSGLTGGFIANRFNSGTNVTNVTRTNAPAIDRSSLAGVAAKVQPSVVDIASGTGEGSGVVLSADGAILTNNHVVADAQGGQLSVTFADGKTAKATLVGTDERGDLAVIKAQGVSNLTAAKFGDSDDMQVGDSVLALGSPLGLQGSVTQGIVSALHRTIGEGAENGRPAQSIGDAIQTDAAINPGNSGGALVNLNGEVIGINTAIATSGQGASGNIGVGFAISSNKAKSTADQLLSGGKVSHPYLGVSVGNGDGGALLADVVAGGPADKAGLKKGDLVTKIADKNIGDSNALVGAVQTAKAGDQVQITFKRDGNQQQVTVTLGDQ